MGIRLDESQPFRELNFYPEDIGENRRHVEFVAVFVIGSSYYNVTIDSIRVFSDKPAQLHGWVRKVPAPPRLLHPGGGSRKS